MNSTLRTLIVTIAIFAIAATTASGATATWKAGAVGNFHDDGGGNANWIAPDTAGWDPDAGNDGQADGIDDIYFESGSTGAVLTLNLEYYRSWNKLNTVDIPAGNTFQVNANVSNMGTITNAGVVKLINNKRLSSDGLINNTGTVWLNDGSTLAIPSVDNTGGGLVQVDLGATWSNPKNATMTSGTLTLNGTLDIDNEAAHNRGLTLISVAATSSGTIFIRNHAPQTSYQPAEVILSGTTTLANSGTIRIENGSYDAQGRGDTYFQVNGTATLTTIAASDIQITQQSGSTTGNDAWLNLDASPTPFTNHGSIKISSLAATQGTAQLRSARDIINNGTITVTGPASSIVLSNGAELTVGVTGTLGGNGTIIGNTTIQGTHNPGNSPGIETFTGNLTYSGGSSVVNWELVSNALVARGTDFDGIDVSGNLDFADPTTLNAIFNLAGESTVDWTESFWTVPYPNTVSWLLYDVAGTTTNAGNLTLDAGAWLDSNGLAFATARPKGYFELSQQGNDIFLSYGMIPEPTSGALLALASLTGLRRKRRH